MEQLIIIVVGGAATGCQVASVFQAFGSQATILEIAPWILRQEDLAVSSLIEKAFRSQGMNIITGFEKLRGIEISGPSLRLDYTQTGEEKSLTVDAVILSTSWVGNLESLNLSAAGVETVGPYVRVNESLQTSVPHIFAVGNITGRMMLVQSSGYEALFAAVNAVLEGSQPLRKQIVPHGGFTDPEYGSVGLT